VIGYRSIRGAALLGLALAMAGLAGSAVEAHGPNPLLGTGTWGQDQVVGYSWAAGQVPPSWMVPAIDAGAGDVGESRGSRAAFFSRISGAASAIAYGVTPCSSYGIACMDRTGVPTKFAGMWFRPQGYVYDWGSLRWCQAQVTFTDGCYDVENVALDEFGHIEILGHHVNFDDASDFLDSVVQVSARTRPRAGWNEHVFGRCDVARLQLEYERIGASSKVSTCLSLASTSSVTASQGSIYVGQTVTFWATLRIASDSAYKRLAGDALSNRTVLLQRRALGTYTWTTVTTMTPSASSDGAYSASWSPTATYDWRVLFPTPTDEGLVGAGSIVIRVSVSGCSGAGCPQKADIGGR
jgi:hypothetical protein